MNILISAGHHPEKPGACSDGFCEHDEALRWVQAMFPHLEGYAIIVPPGVLASKVNFINARSPAVALEIHFNSDPAHRGVGSETLYFPGSVKGKLLAQCVQNHLRDVFAPDRGVKEGYYQMNEAKGPDFFLSRTHCPSIIIEPEFIHNRDKIQDLREVGVAAIAAGVLEFLEKGVA